MKHTKKTLTTKKTTALNYRETLVIYLTLFNKNNKDIKIKKSSTIKDRNGNKQKQASWECHGCDKDKMADLRQCGKLYNEKCVV